MSSNSNRRSSAAMLKKWLKLNRVLHVSNDVSQFSAANFTRLLVFPLILFSLQPRNNIFISDNVSVSSFDVVFFYFFFSFSSVYNHKHIHSFTYFQCWLFFHKSRKIHEDARIPFWNFIEFEGNQPMFGFEVLLPSLWATTSVTKLCSFAIFHFN